MTVVKDPVRIDTDHDYRELRARAECYRPQASALGNYYGLTHTNLFVRTRFTIHIEKASEGVTGRLREVRLSLHMGDPTVYLIDDLGRESCAFDAILAHEKGHVAIDETLVDAYAPRFEAAAQKAVRETGTARGPDREAVIAVFRKALFTALQSEMNDLETERSRRHGEHDTYQEYRRLMRICDGEARELLSQAKKNSRPWHVDVDCPKPPWAGGAS